MEFSATATILNKYGFHVRPSTRFFEVASKFASTVRIATNGVDVDGKSVMMLMTLGAACGAEVTITCNGPDAREATDALVALINSRFDGIE